MKSSLPRTNANPLIDAAVKACGVRNDSQLARYLGIDKSYLSRARRRDVAVGPTLLVALSEAMDVPTKQLKALLVEVA
jgi:transcriptional regulator with XRE-family HTH domain